ncbi:MAG: hypothetical protein ACO3C1_07535 [Ilumatobacteraceae bacterium]
MRRRLGSGHLVVSAAVLSAFVLSACGPTPGNGPGDIEARNSSTTTAGAPVDTAPVTTSAPPVTEPSKPVSWSWDEASASYVPTGTPPECPSPLIDEGALLDLGAVQSKLLPGQVRDGEYLVNGTFRWSGPDQPYPTDVVITMPFDGYVTGAWQFLKSGVYLFGLNIVHPCGLMVRLSKMHDPSPEVKSALLDALGEAREKDSRETFYNPGIWLPKGTVLATSVGVPPPNDQPDVVGAQLDVAILDLRARNPQIPDDFDFTQWSGSAAPQYVFFQVCFYQGDYLSANEQAIIESLPLGGGSPDSDTCVSS